MSELPDGWTAEPLGSIAECRLGKMLDAEKNQGLLRPYLRNTNVQWGSIELSDIKEMRIEDDERDRYGVRPGDLLVCEGGEPGRCAVWRNDREMYLQKALHRVRPLNGTSVDYLRWFMQHAVGSGALESLYTGSTIKHLPGRQLARIPVPAPPPAEQNRIAARLEQIDARRTSIAVRLAAARQIVTRLRNAVLAAACSGRLTEDWREEHPSITVADVLHAILDGRVGQRRARAPEPCRIPPAPIPETWKWVTFGSVIGELRNGVSPAPAMEPPGIPILRISATRPGSVYLNDRRFLRQDPTTWQSFALHDGDLLFTRYNGSLSLVGVCGMVRGLGSELVLYPDKLMRVRLDHDLIVPEYIELFFSEPGARRRMTDGSVSSAGQRGVSGATVKSQAFALPPLEEQHEIVRRAEAALDAAERLGSTISAASAALDNAMTGALAKAFRGQLMSGEADLADT